MPADSCVGIDTLPGMENFREKVRKHHASCMRLLSDSKSITDLPDNLRLSQNHRIQPGGHAHKVLYHIMTSQTIEVLMESPPTKAPLLRKKLLNRIPTPLLFTHYSVNLQTVACGEDYDLT